MEAREKRFLLVVSKNDLSQFAKLMVLAKEAKLTMGRVITMAKAYQSRRLSASSGDCALELVGITAAGSDFLNTVQSQLTSVTATQASAKEVNVR